MILPFIVKTFISLYLGAEYLGLSSLFTFIITVQNLTELGFGTAMVYNMYKPIAEDDYKQINKLLSLYKKVYLIIGIIIFVAGFIMIPFIGKFIKGDVPDGVNIYLLFLVELFNKSIGYYLFEYRQSLLVAYQREDINSIVNLISQVLLKISQILVLICTRNYLLYVLCSPIFNVLNNILILYFAKNVSICKIFRIY